MGAHFTQPRDHSLADPCTKRRRNPQLPLLPSLPRGSLFLLLLGARSMSVCFSFPHCRPFLLSRIEVFTEPIVRVRPSLPPSVRHRSPVSSSALQSASLGRSPIRFRRKQSGKRAGKGLNASAGERMDGEGRGERTRTDTTRRRRTAGARSRAPSPLAKNPSGGARFPRAFLDQGSRSNGVCTVHCALWVGRRDNNV